MYKRLHHQKVAKVLNSLNAEFLSDAKCFFSDGTVLALTMGEYRESVDIDFLCADVVGYSKLRSSVFNNSLGDIFKEKIDLMREVRSDRDGIRAVLRVDNSPIKFEILREARIDLTGEVMPDIPVLCLSKSDLFSEKLLANADRWNHRSEMNRDLSDLIMMEKNWGAIPQSAISKAINAYGDSVEGCFKKSVNMLNSDRIYFNECVLTMGIDADNADFIKHRLDELNKTLNPDKK